jgi:hypothetical protein
MSIIKPVSAYVYQGIHKITHEIYFGARYANISIGIRPEEDLGKKYFTSCKNVKNRFHEFEWIILAQFGSKHDALLFEDDLIRNNWKNPLLINKNRGGKKFHRPDNYIQKPKSPYPKSISETLKRHWQNPEFRERMCAVRRRSHTTEEFRRNHSESMKKVSQQSKNLCRVCRLSDQKEMTVQNFSRYPV